MTDLLHRSAADLGRAIDAGAVDPVALAEAYLEAAEAQGDPGIYARLTPDRARAEARAAAARARAGTRRGPLDGVPLSWKDIYDTAGVATEAGTALMAGRVPERDAEVLRNATLGGSVCLGKTHLSEIAFSGLGYNPVTATPRNRHDPERVPGGSSSGAALSVVHGLAAASIGSDTGGSIRLPAAWSDLVGFKPTHGRLPLTGIVSLAASFDTVGPLARSVEDAALVTALLEGSTAPDLTGATLEGARLVIPDALVMEDVEDAPARAFDDAVRRLEAAGARVETRALPMIAPAYDLAGILYAGEAWAAWEPLIAPAPERMFKEIYERVSAGAEVSAAQFLQGWAALRAHRRAYAAATAGADAVILPTAPLVAPRIAEITADSAYYKSANLRTLRNTRLANLFGLASLQLPTGHPGCGICLNVAPGADDRLLRLGAAAEAAVGGPVRG
ncbi:amidase [Wenxinia saemankumensis]|uniref:Aspartyl-tRNA(Asn)/glutamyl-tRNA(Gln) amidotransferase subunit A n=1 Tax=Wenxinia saemankumensis TaxID=1447782 RepID=A0A1M6FVV1_9RHOB|nr:amidase family protein [Wenxinia saemankumensis]SHJ01824.1 aspartyl-tRNA(Asn)/glutamyl-tRNA(Gln) amidotransferase subunit A [Wenxinia saemankumensis]